MITGFKPLEVLRRPLIWAAFCVVAASGPCFGQSEERIRARIAELKAEHVSGLEQRKALEARIKELDATLLRISGAIQVLEELLVRELSE